MSRIIDIAQEMKTWWSDEGSDIQVQSALDEIIRIDQERAEQTEPQTDGYMTAEQTGDYRNMLDKAERKVYGNIEDEPQTDCSWR